MKPGVDDGGGIQISEPRKNDVAAAPAPLSPRVVASAENH